MSRDHTHSLVQCRLRATHDESKCEHGPGEQLDRNLENDEMRLLAAVVLCKGVNECQEESLSEDNTSQGKSGCQLCSS